MQSKIFSIFCLYLFLVLSPISAANGGSATTKQMTSDKKMPQSNEEQVPELTYKQARESVGKYIANDGFLKHIPSYAKPILFNKEETLFGKKQKKWTITNDAKVDNGVSLLGKTWIINNIKNQKMEELHIEVARDQKLSVYNCKNIRIKITATANKLSHTEVDCCEEITISSPTSITSTDISNCKNVTFNCTSLFDDAETTQQTINLDRTQKCRIFLQHSAAELANILHSECSNITLFKFNANQYQTFDLPSSIPPITLKSGKGTPEIGDTLQYLNRLINDSVKTWDVNKELTDSQGYVIFPGNNFSLSSD